MKLRIALKIRKAILTNRECRYSAQQIQAALNRYDKTKEAKSSERCFNALMIGLGVEGRAQMIQSWDAGAALDLLVQTPPEKWKGDWSEWDKWRQEGD